MKGNVAEITYLYWQSNNVCSTVYSETPNKPTYTKLLLQTLENYRNVSSMSDVFVNITQTLYKINKLVVHTIRQTQSTQTINILAP